MLVRNSRGLLTRRLEVRGPRGLDKVAQVVRGTKQRSRIRCAVVWQRGLVFGNGTVLAGFVRGTGGD